MPMPKMANDPFGSLSGLVMLHAPDDDGGNEAGDAHQLYDVFDDGADHGYSPACWVSLWP